MRFSMRGNFLFGGKNFIFKNHRIFRQDKPLSSKIHFSTRSQSLKGIQNQISAMNQQTNVQDKKKNTKPGNQKAYLFHFFRSNFT